MPWQGWFVVRIQHSFRPLTASRSTAAAGFLSVLIVAVFFTISVTAAGPAHARKYAHIIIDAATGKVLDQSHPDRRIYPASLTKMMTLYLTFEALQAGRIGFGTRLTVSSRAARQPPSRLGLKPGQTISVDDAIRSLVTKSANDVAVVIAEGLGGSERKFAQLMTRRARTLGMRDTVFRNASGLPNSRQVTTARDIAKLARALILRFPRYYHYFSLQAFEYRGRTYRNHNRLMRRYEGMDGLKTGYIRASGFNLAASAVRDGWRVIAVVIGGRTSRTRDNQMEKLLDETFAAGPPRLRGTAGIQVASLTPMLPGGVGPSERRGWIPAAKPLPDFLSEQGIDGESGFRPPVKPDRDSMRGGRSSLRTAYAGPSPSAEGDAEFQSGEEDRLVRLAVVPARKDFSRLWGIQVGAFYDRDNSRRAIGEAETALRSQFGRLVTRLEETATGRGPVYRARLYGFSGRTEGVRACNQLTRVGGKCLVIGPRG